MRSLPVHAAQGRVYLPADRLIRHGTSPERVLAGEASQGLGDVLGELRGEARRALNEASRDLAGLDPSVATAFRPLCLVGPYLAALEKSAGDPFREIATINPLYRLWRLATWR
jgi:phytoene synthase